MTPIFESNLESTRKLNHEVIMLQYIAACPYCISVVAVDVDTRQLVFNPGCFDNGPCGHLVCFSVCVSVDRLEGEGGIPQHDASIDWFWELGLGLREFSAADADYMHLFLENEFRPASEHEFVWLTAQDRENLRPGSGEFHIRRPGPGVFVGTLDAFALFGLEPNRILDEVYEGVRDLYVATPRTHDPQPCRNPACNEGENR